MADEKVRRVTLTWTGLSGGPYFTQLFFGHNPGAAENTSAHVHEWVMTTRGLWVTGLTCTQNTEQDIIDTVTGGTVQTDVATAKVAVAGQAASEVLPFATQGVIKLQTAQFNEGRRLQGRIFIPGPAEGSSVNGAPEPGYLSTLNTTAATLISHSQPDGPWAVYSRRYKGWASVSGASGWNKWGSQRRRRD